MTTDDTRICVECGHRISGRIDKKYCNDQCRTAWHNRHHSGRNNYMRNVETILRRNRRILAMLHTSGQRKVEDRVLRRLGFEFNYFTHQEKRRGTAWHYCYEHGYTQLGRGQCLISCSVPELA